MQSPLIQGFRVPILNVVNVSLLFCNKLPSGKDVTLYLICKIKFLAPKDVSFAEFCRNRPSLVDFFMLSVHVFLPFVITYT